MFRRFTAILLATSFLTSCGGATPARPPAQASKEVARLTLLISSDSPPARYAGLALSGRLVKAGYQLVEASDDVPDMVLELQTSVKKTTGIIKTHINGELQQTTRVMLLVVLKAGGIVLETASTEFDEEDSIDPNEADRIVAVLTNSAALHRYAKRIIDEEKARDRRADDLVEEKRQAARQREKDAQNILAELALEESIAWNSLVSSACTEPTEMTGCDGYHEFLRIYPAGKYAEQARNILSASVPKLYALRDQITWNTTRVEACRKPKQSTDCDSLVSYLKSFPTGAYAHRAKVIIEESSEEIARLAAKEAQEAERASLAEKKKIHREAVRECKAGCREECDEACVDWKTGKPRPPCVSRCVSQCNKRCDEISLE